MLLHFLKVTAFRFLLLTFLLTTIPTGMALAGGGHGDNKALDYTVDTSNLSGVSLFLGNLYNNHRTWFATVATVSMAALGAIIAISTEYILKLVGLNVSKTSRRG
ncbi:MAG: hypothetical protein GY855_11270 [candidate division Zixibacteria bacterium]|nr:hypothetical protein [candidate division Zixibacteria bacterium]